MERRLGSLGPEATLRRGYSRVTRRADGRTVATTGEACDGLALRVHVFDGTYDAVVEGQPTTGPRKEV